MLSNAILAISIENANGLVDLKNGQALEDQEDQLLKKQSYYFAAVLWSTFALSMVRFAGVSTSSSRF